MSEKVKVTKEQAAAINYLLEDNYPYKKRPDAIVVAHINDPSRWVGTASEVTSMPVDTLIRALYIGYEVEQTPEERAVEWLAKEYGGTLHTLSRERIVKTVAKIINGEEQAHEPHTRR